MDGVWRRALVSRSLWRRALAVALPVGFTQVAVNQGDLWIRHFATGAAMDPAVIAKTLASPLITITVSFVSAALEFVEREKRETCD
jgi:hypothetical protein